METTNYQKNTKLRKLSTKDLNYGEPRSKNVTKNVFRNQSSIRNLYRK